MIYIYVNIYIYIYICMYGRDKEHAIWNEGSTIIMWVRRGFVGFDRYASG